MYTFKIKDREIGGNNPTYFIADIAANHDGDLNKAIDLIHSAAESGGDAAKFQHFQADTIVSDFGFKSLGEQKSHQKKWSKTVYQVYKDASLPLNWTPILKEECEKAKIDFFTSPYSLELVDFVDKFLDVYKIGSGDVSWIEIIQHIAKKNKPVLIATGASDMNDVERAFNTIEKFNKKICIMQCNTNYTAKKENLNFVNLNFIKTLKRKFPNIVYGLSDHTHGHATVLGAIALGARVVEKHFTLNNVNEGPDHEFSMNPVTWREMINCSRELEAALGDGQKKVQENEKETYVLQRRSLRAKQKLNKGHLLQRDDLVVLRPCPKDSIQPYEIEKLIGKKLKINIEKHQIIKWQDLV